MLVGGRNLKAKNPVRNAKVQRFREVGGPNKAMRHILDTWRPFKRPHSHTGPLKGICKAAMAGSELDDRGAAEETCKSRCQSTIDSIRLSGARIPCAICAWLHITLPRSVLCLHSEKPCQVLLLAVGFPSGDSAVVRESTMGAQCG
eukprot:1624075-Prymnesium_polylepis.1